MIEYRITATHQFQPTILAGPNPDPAFIGQLFEALAVMTDFADLSIQYREVGRWEKLAASIDDDSDVHQ